MAMKKSKYLTGKRPRTARKRIEENLLNFRRSVSAARILAKLGSMSLTDVPSNFPVSEKKLYNDTLNRHLDMVQKVGLPWVKVGDDKWVAIPIIEELSEDGIANDILFLKQFSKPASRRHPGMPIQHIALEQCIITLFAQFDAFLQEQVKEICCKEKRILATNKQVTWEFIVKTSSLSRIMDKLISDYLLDFGYKNIRQKINFMINDIGLTLDIDQTTIDNLFMAEQARHLFTHNGGFVSEEFVKKTKSKKYAAGDRIGIDYNYCNLTSRALQYIAQETTEKILHKYFRVDIDNERKIAIRDSYKLNKKV